MNSTQRIRYYITGILDTYATIFYSQNKVFGFLLLLASFMFPPAGICGLIAVITSLNLAQLLNFDRRYITDGTLTYNSLLVGIGLGMMYQLSFLLVICVVFAAVIALLLTVLVWNISSRYEMPFLSIPFLFCFWIVLPALHYFKALSYNIPVLYYTDFLTQIGGENLAQKYLYYNNSWLPLFFSSYLKTLSVIFFQNNIFTGVLVGLAIGIHSRIALSLTLLGYTVAYLFYSYAGIDLQQLTQFHAGFNYIIVPVAIGSFYTIPSFRSYLIALLAAIGSVMLSLGINDSFMKFGSSAYSLPFVMTVYLVLTALKFRTQNQNPQLVTYQYFSPEKNLYKQQYNSFRLRNLKLFRFQLPFFGDWMVTQAYNGKHTHKGDWAQALDFVLVDDELKQHQGDGTMKEDFYCFNKPVMSPGDGWVSAVTNHVDDNEIGAVNLLENWGNTIVIYHAEGVYSQISHLRKGSITVKVGDFVKRGDLIARCGNSGRSPVPHIHFQLQALPTVGAKTIAYPIAYFIKKQWNGAGNTNKLQFASYELPNEGETVQNVENGRLLQQAFNLVPGKKLNWSYTAQGLEKHVSWECFTDSLNQTYLYCAESKSTAYFINDGSVFYCTDFEGDKSALLYYFYLSTCRIMLGHYLKLPLKDTLPLNLFVNKWFFWNDFISPFFNLVQANYESEIIEMDDQSYASAITIASSVKVKWFKRLTQQYQFLLQCDENGISHFEINTGRLKINAQCIK